MRNPSRSESRRCPSSLLPTLSLSMFLGLWVACSSDGGARKSQGAHPAAPPPSRMLFDGRTLAGWAESDFAGKGEVRVEEGTLILGTGFMTGITYTNGPLPHTNYEISLDAMRVDGTDFFCGLTFPVGESHCSFIVGGWGGGVVGLSSIDGEDAANNNTTRYMNFESGRWYALRMRVTPQNLSAWIDEAQVVDQDIAHHQVGIRIEMEACVPLGVATYSTTGALRNFQLREL